MINVPRIEDNGPFRVLGIYGEFLVQPAKWKVCHFSTYASSSKSSRAGNTASLLAELKPMRERVRPKDISDMSALLQRDLNDVRVANELVPYLLKNHAEIGLFPAVLCALLPVGFLEDMSQSGVGPGYPDPTRQEGFVTTYGTGWKLTLFPVSGASEPSALGELWIDPAMTDIVVLDGQHRANAFRFATNAFPDATRTDSIYFPFYKDQRPGQDFKSELPVTVVWFERLTSEKIDPKLISRRLFVDVNTNSKAVNQSRNILLDDITPAAIFTGIFYSELAKNSFSPSQLSLLHGAFDCDNDQSRSAVALFSPLAIEYALRLFTLGLDRCDAVAHMIERDRSRDHQNATRLGRFVDTLSVELQGKIDRQNILTTLRSSNVRVGVAQSAISYAYRLLSEFTLFHKHVESCVALRSAILAGEWSNTTRLLVWENVYCGGEGLFSSLKTDAIGTGVATYVAAINEIEEKFKELRLSTCALLESGDATLLREAYVGATSIAGIAALLMTAASVSAQLGWVYDDNGRQRLCIDEVIELLNKTSIAHWTHILSEFRRGVVAGGLEPKKWPLIRNIYLRVIQDNSNGKFDFFASRLAASPDYRFVEESYKAECRSFASLNGRDATVAECLELRGRALIKLKNCLVRCGLKPILPANLTWPEAAQSTQSEVNSVDNDPAEDDSAEDGGVADDDSRQI